MKIYRTKDINELFTKVVQKYLAQGLSVNLNTMSGSQGEIAKVDLTDGEHIYRIRIEKEHHFEKHIDILRLEVRLYEANNDKIDDSFHTLWNSQGQLIENINFYELDGRGYADVYTIDEKFADECEEKRFQRFRATHPQRKPLNVDNKRVCRNIVNNHKGYKSVRPAEIKKVARHKFGYKIEFWAKDSILIYTKK